MRTGPHDATLPQQEPMTYAPVTFLLSSRGYGLLLDTTTQATFDLRWSGDRCYRVRSESPEMHVYLIAGPHPQTVIERHAHLVGLPPLPPAWAFGVWKTLIGGQARVTSDFVWLRGDDVPVDTVWIYDTVDQRAGFG